MPIVHNSAKASGNPEAYWDMLKRNHPIGRIANVAEVVAFYTYMASDYISFFTGFDTDDGRRLRSPITGR
jgi:hypothetical protein